MTDFNLPSIFVPLVGLKVNAISESKKVNYLGKNMISAVFFTPREIEQKAAELAYFLRYQLQFFAIVRGFSSIYLKTQYNEIPL
ncbi:hypothetical protein ACJX0J_000609, partial [Zea mays]